MLHVERQVVLVAESLALPGEEARQMGLVAVDAVHVPRLQALQIGDEDALPLKLVQMAIQPAERHPTMRIVASSAGMAMGKQP